jgi:hypothetical protein
MGLFTFKTCQIFKIKKEKGGDDLVILEVVEAEVPLRVAELLWS